MMKKYEIEMSRHQAALYLAAEYGTRGAIRIFRGLKPFGVGDNGGPWPWFRQAGAWCYIDVRSLGASRRMSKTYSRFFLRRIAEYVAWQEGRLGKPLCGSAGIMSVIEG